MRLMRPRLLRLTPAAVLLIGGLLAGLIGPGASNAQDPYAWLEDIHDPRALAWVAEENAKTSQRLEGDARFEPARATALTIFTSKDRIPLPELRAGGVDNLWQDSAHPHGIWRRTSLQSFDERDPAWETLLDLDALSLAEGKSFFWKGASCLRPEERYCLVRLSNGGGDAVEVREFDTVLKTFVAGGFNFSAAKQSQSYLDRDTIIVARPQDGADTTRSGYAATLKLQRRGAPAKGGRLVFAGEVTDGGGVNARVLRDDAGKPSCVIMERSVGDYDARYAVWRPGDVGPSPLDLPPKSRLGVALGDDLTMTLQEDWRGFKAGDLVSLDTKQFPVLTPRLIFRPNARQTLDQVAATRAHLLVAILEDVKGAVIDYALEEGRWTGRRLPMGAFSSIALRGSARDTDVAFLTTESFLEPPTLWRLDARTGALLALKTLPPQFDAKGLQVEQLWAASADGVKIPYFLVRPKAAPGAGGFPTLMFGYGGFLISEAPAYKPELGRLWLEKGGAYVLADIRGGGEFGPAWHDAALRQNRQKAFDDFAAIAMDVEQRKLTSPRRLGIYGRSNGGILTSVSITQHPELFGAAVVESPLVDMLRYTHLSAGASWIGEYGDPDLPQDRAFIEKYSAYQNIRPGMAYPEAYVTTNTEDDRVHPGHARKLAAKLQGLGYPCLYYENTFGGHANDAAPDLNARRWARHYVYLMQKLMD